MTSASVRFADVTVGDTLPPLEVPLTRTRIVAGAIASRDFQEVHHDPELARDRGSKDIIMNILTTNGYVGRYITDWAGPDAVISSIKIRLGAPNYPGDTMTLTGTVRELDPEARRATLDVVGANSIGNHVTAAVEVVLP